MAEYIDKERFLASMGLTGDETKYGNRDAEHMRRSYSTYMSYEIMDSVDDCIVEEELVPVVHGRWKERFNMVGRLVWDCSECDTTSLEHGLYCPYCGAHMKDGE